MPVSFIKEALREINIRSLVGLVLSLSCSQCNDFVK